MTKYVQSRLLQNCRMRERVKEKLLIAISPLDTMCTTLFIDNHMIISSHFQYFCLDIFSHLLQICCMGKMDIENQCNFIPGEISYFFIWTKYPIIYYFIFNPPFPYTRNLQQIPILEEKTQVQILKRVENFAAKRRNLLMSIFSFCNNVFKICLQYWRQNVSTCGKSLRTNTKFGWPIVNCFTALSTIFQLYHWVSWVRVTITTGQFILTPASQY